MFLLIWAFHGLIYRWRPTRLTDGASSARWSGRARPARARCGASGTPRPRDPDARTARPAGKACCLRRCLTRAYSPRGFRAGRFARRRISDAARPRQRKRRQKSRAGLFRRPRHVDHPQMAADHLWLRGRHLHRRSRPGRGTGAGASEGADARHQAGEHLHRGSARGIRARLRVSDVPRQCALRGPVSARHLDRAAADRQEADRDRREGRRRCGRAWRDRQGQRSGALRARLLRAQARREGDRAVARMGIPFARGAASPSPSRIRSRSPRTNGARRRSRPTPISCTPRRRARCWKIPAEEVPDYVYSRTDDPEDAPDEPAYVTIDFERGDPVAVDGKKLSPAELAGAAQQRSAASTASAGSIWSRTASSA